MKCIAALFGLLVVGCSCIQEEAGAPLAWSQPEIKISNSEGGRWLSHDGRDYFASAEVKESSLIVKLNVIDEGVEYSQWIGAPFGVIPCRVLESGGAPLRQIDPPYLMKEFIPARCDVEIRTAAILKPESRSVMVFEFDLKGSASPSFVVQFDLGSAVISLDILVISKARQ